MPPAAGSALLPFYLSRAVPGALRLAVLALPHATPLRATHRRASCITGSVPAYPYLPWTCCASYSRWGRSGGGYLPGLLPLGGGRYLPRYAPGYACCLGRVRSHAFWRWVPYV